MKVIFLGTGAGSSLGSKRMMSSIAILTNNYEGFLFDLGSASFARLEDYNLLEKIKEVYVTHLHIDHISGIFDFLVHRKVFSSSKVTIYAPEGLSDIFLSLKKVGNDITYNLYEFSSKLYRRKSDIEIYNVEACHSIKAFSYVIIGDNGKHKIVYTGDTSEPCEPILEEAQSADLIIHEMTCLDNCKKWGHTSYMDLLNIFPNDKLKKVVVTHIPSQLETKIEEFSLDKVLKIAYDGLVIEL
ncbi:MAG: MBL fold metallo-hydrolase [Sulfolobus sp.]|nr:MBL fold metallo-hydrolase [Sulfolobus sp.]